MCALILMGGWSAAQRIQPFENQVRRTISTTGNAVEGSAMSSYLRSTRAIDKQRLMGAPTFLRLPADKSESPWSIADERGVGAPMASSVLWTVLGRCGNLIRLLNRGIALTQIGTCLTFSSENRGSPLTSAGVLVEAAGIELQIEK